MLVNSVLLSMFYFIYFYYLLGNYDLQVTSTSVKDNGL